MDTAEHGIDALYRRHAAILQERYEGLMEALGLAGVVLHSGVPRTVYGDDHEYPLKVSPWYRQWVPEGAHSGSYVLLRPGARPRLVCHLPQDYWTAVPEPPAGDWTGALEIETVPDPGAALAALPGDTGAMAFVGEPVDEAFVGRFGQVNPRRLLAPLCWDRLRKTAYEAECVRRANLVAARGHLAAREAFEAGAGELEIHLAYLAATGQMEQNLPYGNIVALNEHGATLHYGLCEAQPPAERRSLLIDAGAVCNGYAADVTRSWPAADDAYAELVDALDAVQQEIVAEVRPGVSFVDLHLAVHVAIGGLLRDFGLVDMGPEAMAAHGVTTAFFPHGLGHQLGLLVHDVGGKQADRDGEMLPQPDDHPYLRNLRPVEEGNVITIEPGIYFIDSLLAELRRRPEGRRVDWPAVEALVPFGGVRIEDDVWVSPAGVRNLTREAFDGF